MSLEELQAENYTLRCRLQALREAEFRAKSTIATYIYENNLEQEELKSKIKYLKEQTIQLKAEVNLFKRKEDDADDLQLDEGGEIKAGKVDKLVDALYVDHGDRATSKYTNVFLLTYRSFVTPREVLETLLTRFNLLVSDSSEAGKVARLRIANFLRRWINDNFYEFADNKDFLDRLGYFIGVIIKSEAKLGATLQSSLQQKIRGGQRRQTTAVFSDKPPASLVPKGPITSIVEVAPLEIARQLTLIDYNLCRAIEPRECLGMAWTKENKEKRSPNLLAMIRRFNQVSKWISFMIVSETNLKNRTKILNHIIQMLGHMWELNNFNGIFQIIGGLGNASVHRLSKTFAGLKPDNKKLLEEMRFVSNPEKSWANYRKRLHEVNPPLVPFIGVYQTDLTFIEDGNPDKFSSGLINFKKCRLTASVIEEIQTYQAKPYNLSPLVLVDEWLERSFQSSQIDEKKLFELSLLAEPRESSS